MYNCFKELSTDIVFNVLYIYIFFILFYIMYNIHVVKRFRAHCGFYAIENKLLLLLYIIIIKRLGEILLSYIANTSHTHSPSVDVVSITALHSW